MKDYHINIFYSDEDQATIADIPDLKYCSASAETPQQALQEVLIAPRLIKFSESRKLSLGLPLGAERLVRDSN